MKTKIAIIIVLFSVALFTGCVATKLLASRKTSEETPKQYQKLGVVVISPSMSNRSTVEMEIAETFRKKGIKAVATFDIFPFVGKMDEIREKMDEEMVQQKIRQRVGDNNLDALLIITLLDKNKETRYVEGTSFSLAAPVYGYPYYGYYNYAYSTAYSPGYYETTTSYFIESNLYDVATEKLLWTGQTKTENPESVEKEAPNLAQILVDAILLQKALVP